MYSQALSPLVISSNLYKPVLHVESSVETIGPGYCHFNYSISFRACDATYDDIIIIIIIFSVCPRTVRFARRRGRTSRSDTLFEPRTVRSIYTYTYIYCVV